jgi:tRNA threonylcarbamoyladenosine biosynthesis protein TsaB
MTILAIETTAKMGGISIIRNREIIAENMYSGVETYCKRLIPDIEKMFNSLDISWQELSAVAVSIGPGSFTGLRIGIATAKAIAFSLDIPILGIPTLDALAMNIAPCHDLLICPVIDARKEQIYTAIYKYNENELIKTTPYIAIKPIEFFDTITQIGKTICFLGDGLKKYQELFNAFFPKIKYMTAPENLCYVKSSNIAWLADSRLKKGQTHNPATLQPIYIRPSDAEVKKMFPDKVSPIFYE